MQSIKMTYMYYSLVIGAAPWSCQSCPVRACLGRTILGTLSRLVSHLFFTFKFCMSGLSRFSICLFGLRRLCWNFAYAWGIMTALQVVHFCCLTPHHYAPLSLCTHECCKWKRVNFRVHKKSSNISNTEIKIFSVDVKYTLTTLWDVTCMKKCMKDGGKVRETERVRETVTLLGEQG